MTPKHSNNTVLRLDSVFMLLMTLTIQNTDNLMMFPKSKNMSWMTPSMINEMIPTENGKQGSLLPIQNSNRIWERLIKTFSSKNQKLLKLETDAKQLEANEVKSNTLEK